MIDLASKATRSSTLDAMLRSYCRSIGDPSNEMVHLYEIRDAAKAPFGSDEARAQHALGITRADWGRLGRIANREPIAERRHRGGQLSGTRPATADELTTARQIALSTLKKFAATVEGVCLTLASSSRESIVTRPDEHAIRRAHLGVRDCLTAERQAPR